MMSSAWVMDHWEMVGAMSTGEINAAPFNRPLPRELAHSPPITWEAACQNSRAVPKRGPVAEVHHR